MPGHSPSTFSTSLAYGMLRSGSVELVVGRVCQAFGTASQEISGLVIAPRAASAVP
jgi:hypothetical protein